MRDTCPSSGACLSRSDQRSTTELLANTDSTNAPDTQRTTERTLTNDADTTAPCACAGCARPPPPCRGRRFRRRGPRSLEARRLRSGGAPQGEPGGEPPAPSPTPDLSLIHSQQCTLLHINIRSLNNPKKHAELQTYLNAHQPHYIAITETWLCDATPHFTLPNYTTAARRDRPDYVPRPRTSNHGGIILLRHDNAPALTHLENSTTAERLWATIHLDTGPLLLGLYYRPPDDPHHSLDTLDAELDKHSHSHTGTLLTGDFNIHHKRWLHFSNANTPEGAQLHDICKQHNLTETVRAPTRNNYLLDPFFTSLPSLTKSIVLPKIADHNATLTTLNFHTPLETATTRHVHDFKKADWTSLNATFEHTDWTTILTDDPSTAARNLTDFILTTAATYIPTRNITDVKKTHPWLTDACKHAISQKQLAEGQPHYDEAQKHADETLTSAYHDYQNKLKTQLTQLPRNSKKWWRINRQLLNNEAPRLNIPPLKENNGTWVHDATTKANLFASTFSSKFTLPSVPTHNPDENHDDNDENRHALTTGTSNFILLRTRHTRRLLNSLDTCKATGPDLLPATLLKNCSDTLALPLTLLARSILARGTWPSPWKEHWLTPLHKKKSTSDPTNYRAVHLTSILSKTVERLYALTLVPYFERTNAYGTNQHAFRTKHSCQDLTTLLTCKWLYHFHDNKKIGLFLSDIQGAFDRVHTPTLLRKLQLTGLHPTWLTFFTDYLSPRNATVIVNGKHSTPFTISHMVFQGTVLGPLLWNIFFKDIETTVTNLHLHETKFADDLSTFKTYPTSTPNDDIYNDLRNCQSHIHNWGTTNGVAFDTTKEEFAILHHFHGHGNTFKLLGPHIDPKLTMNNAITKIINKARPKLKALLRTAPYYNRHELFTQYKTHVLPILETANGAIYHASTSVLAPIDSLYSSFLHATHTTELYAFLNYNLAPPTLRRDISLLGLLHKINLGLTHSDFNELFPRASPTHLHATRLSERRHNRQLRELCDGTQTDQLNRSLFALVRIYNLLPQTIVNAKTVTHFQTLLTRTAKNYANHDDNFATFFSPRRSPTPNYDDFTN